MQSSEKSTNTRTKSKHFSGIKRKGKEISVFVCCVTFKENQKASKTWSDEDYKNDAVEVTPLSQAVLKKYIS